MPSRLYVQEAIPTEKLFLSNEEYARALRAFVKYCHDVVPVGPDSLWYLPARRADKNRPGPWFVGGAVIPFISLKQSLQRTLKRELGLDIAPDRPRHVAQHRYFFNEADGLAHDAVCEMFALPLSHEELASISLDLAEYENAQLVPHNGEKIAAMKDPITRQAFSDLWQDRAAWHL